MDGSTRLLLAALASALAAGVLIPATAGAAQAGPESVAPDGPIMCCPA